MAERIRELGKSVSECFPGVYRAAGRVSVAGPFKGPGNMYVVKDESAVVVIDPIRLNRRDQEMVDGIGTPTDAIILGPNHERDTVAYQKRFGLRVWANRKLFSRIGIGVNTFFESGDALPAGLLPIDMPGTFHGETVLHHPPNGGVLLVGDAIFNLQNEDLNAGLKLVGPLGLVPLGVRTMPRLFMDDPVLARESYRKLLECDFEGILVSHGQPILSDARNVLESLISSL